jgi:hypothetical protein
MYRPNIKENPLFHPTPMMGLLCTQIRNGILQQTVVVVVVVVVAAAAAEVIVVATATAQ